MFKTGVWALGLAVSLAGAAPSQAAMWGGSPAVTSRVETVQYYFDPEDFVVDGQDYCWYDDGWNGPGWYVCGYGYDDGYGWGGGEGWNGFVTHRYARDGRRRHGGEFRNEGGGRGAPRQGFGEFRRGGPESHPRHDNGFAPPGGNGRFNSGEVAPGGGARFNNGFAPPGGNGRFNSGEASPGGGARFNNGFAPPGGNGRFNSGGAPSGGGGRFNGGGAPQGGGGSRQGGGGGGDHRGGGDHNGGGQRDRRQN